jgi:hypothetical protein
MIRLRTVGGKLGRMGGFLILLAVVFILAGCTGQAGRVFGNFDYDYSLYYGALGGFPPITLYTNTYYQISPGDYAVYYTLYDSGTNTYYPGYYYSAPHDPSYYWYATYGVDANQGQLFWTNGNDKYFSLYLGYDGMYKSGTDRSALPSPGSTPSAPRLGQKTWTDNGMTITVTNAIVQLTPDQIAKLQKNTVVKK